MERSGILTSCKQPCGGEKIIAKKKAGSHQMKNMQQLQKTYRLFVLTALTAGIAIAKQTVPPLSDVVECTAEAAELTGTDSGAELHRIRLL